MLDGVPRRGSWKSRSSRPSSRMRVIIRITSASSSTTNMVCFIARLRSLQSGPARQGSALRRGPAGSGRPIHPVGYGLRSIGMVSPTSTCWRSTAPAKPGHQEHLDLRMVAVDDPGQVEARHTAGITTSLNTRSIVEALPGDLQRGLAVARLDDAIAELGQLHAGGRADFDIVIHHQDGLIPLAWGCRAFFAIRRGGLRALSARQEQGFTVVPKQARCRSSHGRRTVWQIHGPC